MLQIGYKLSSEKQRPSDLVRYAAHAEDAGFTLALISDHYHPWIDKQGQSPFVWCVIGGIAEATEQLQLGTGLTCPTVRIHPAIVAQAAATAAAMMEGRFFLGVGTGENLNEHVVGQDWPETEVRQERLVEAIDVLRRLWQGDYRSHRGRHFTVENARLYTLPKTPPPIMIAVGGRKSAELAGRLADGMVGTSPKKDTMNRPVLRARDHPAAHEDDEGEAGGLASSAAVISTTRPSPQPYFASERARTARQSSSSTPASITRARPAKVRVPTRTMTSGLARRLRTQAASSPCSAIA